MMATIEQVPSMTVGSASKQGWVLVIAREQRLRQLLLTVLSRAGYILLGCATLAEVGQIIAQHNVPRLILYDGAEASETQLRDRIQEITSALPPGTSCRLLIFSLAHPQPRLQQLPGVDGLIARPFDLSVVLEKVNALMQIA